MFRKSLRAFGVVCAVPFVCAWLYLCLISLIFFVLSVAYILLQAFGYGDWFVALF